MKPFTLVALVAMFTATAAARPKEAQSPRSIDVKARAYFDRGRKLSGEGRYTEALAEFSAGYELSRRPLFLFNMAEVARMSGDLERARETYERYLREEPEGKQAAKARERLAEIAPRPTAPADPPPDAAPPKEVAPIPLPESDPVTDPRIVRDRLTHVAPPRRRSAPLLSRPPFWIAVGGAVTAIAAGSVAVYFLTRNDGCTGSCMEIDLR